VINKFKKKNLRSIGAITLTGKTEVLAGKPGPFPLSHHEPNMDGYTGTALFCAIM